MEVDLNLKTVGQRFQVLCLYLAKIIEKHYGLHTLRKFTRFLPLGVKPWQKPRETAPLKVRTPLYSIANSTIIKYPEKLSSKGLAQRVDSVDLALIFSNLISCVLCYAYSRYRLRLMVMVHFSL